MTPIFPGKLAHSPLDGAGGSVIATPLCCHLPSEQTVTQGCQGMVLPDSSSAVPSQFSFPRGLTLDENLIVLMTLLLGGIVVFT